MPSRACHKAQLIFLGKRRVSVVNVFQKKPNFRLTKMGAINKVMLFME